MPVVATTMSGGRAMQAAGRVAQLGVVGERHDPQRRRVHDAGAAPLQQRGELVARAGRR